MEKSLHKFSSIGNFQMVKDLIDNGADVNELDSNGFSPLFYTSNNNSFEIAQYLINNGAQVEIYSGDLGQSPLHWACIMGALEVAYILIENGADIKKKDGQGYTALHLAVQHGQILIAHLLLSKGVPIDIKDSSNHSPLHWTIFKSHDKTSYYLISRGANLNLQDINGNTPLHWAVYTKNTKMIQLLMDKEVNLELKNSEGKLAIQAAEDLPERNTINFIRKIQIEKDILSKKILGMSHKKFFAILPFLVELIIFLVNSYLKFSSGAAISFIIFWILKKWIQNYPKFEPNPIPFGIALSAYAFINITYLLKLRNYLPIFSSRSIITFVIFDILCLVLFIRLITKDPGKIKDPPLDIQKRLQEYISDPKTKRKLLQSSFCPFCAIEMPLRSHHERNSNRCIAHFDHYCIWVLNAVGEDNYHAFIGFTFVYPSILISFVNLIFQALFAEPTLTDFHKFSIFQIIRNIYANQTFLFLNILQSIPLILWGFALFIQYAYLIAINSTSYEKLARTEMGYFWETGSFHNPFKFKNPILNYLQFFKLKKVVDWRKVYTIQEYNSIIKRSEKAQRKIISIPNDSKNEVLLDNDNNNNNNNSKQKNQ
ncbi:palmitoyltransferase hip14 [Anaeramoeba ignava]|uniref:Palmitoyltransferase n=1 Tax=Anaeramoeba ignava TaxID=1746090 RepID=A0A9Q0LRW6_ANAIG|nr:palmitoyltransferase hip14 [Anaeramoeba ignava]